MSHAAKVFRVNGELAASCVSCPWFATGATVYEIMALVQEHRTDMELAEMS